MLGARDPNFSEQNPWEASFSWRYQKSDRHFRGSSEEANRQAEHSEVINTINVLDFTLTRNLNERWSLVFGFPYLMAERSMPIRDDSGVTIDRSISQSRGLGDIIAGARRWMLDPATHPRTNLQLGFGVKLPTGADNVTDTRTRYANGGYVRTIETNDQSIQPGDGGFGVVFDLGWFYRFYQDRCATYFAMTYLFNPEGTSGVYTYRGRESEAYMSIADQYLARLGVTFGVSRTRNVSLGIGGRIEGVPTYDVFGPSDGFRRPGYAVSVEPTFNVSWGKNNFSLAVPVAVYRNRVASVPDMMDGRVGDAAFADWLLIASYTRLFGGKGGPAPAPSTCALPPEPDAPAAR